MDEADEVLRRSPLFAGLGEEDGAALRAGANTIELRRGERLFSEGDSGDQLYVVIEGKIKLIRAALDGRENLISVHGPGDMFGELSLFDPTVRTSSAVAITDSRLTALGHEDLRGWLAGRPDVAMQLLRALAQRLRRITEKSTNMVFTDVPGRVAKALLELADKFGAAQEGGTLVSHDLTQEELAQLVGASRETVNKALAEFVARGWIQLSAKSVLIIDSDRLRRRAR